MCYSRSHTVLLARSRQERKGVVLLAVLIVITLLALAAYQYSDLITQEYKASNASMRAAQANAAAHSALHAVMVLLSSQDAINSSLQGNYLDNQLAFQWHIDPANSDLRVSIVAPRNAEDPEYLSLPYRFGVIDESSKINLNDLMKLDSSGTAAQNVLSNIPILTSDQVDSILNWIAPPNSRQNQAADEQYYQSLTPPYHCKCAPLDSLDELMLIKGIGPDVFYGGDANLSGVPSNTQQPDETGTLNRGLLSYLTIYSKELNIDSTGALRLNINQPLNSQDDVSTFYTDLVTALSGSGQDGSALASFIIGYRLLGGTSSTSSSTTTAPATGGGGGGATTTTVTYSNGPIPMDQLQIKQGSSAQSISSVYLLFNAQVSISTTQGNRTTTTIYRSPLANDANTIQNYAPVLFDKLTTTSNQTIPARVNINTAPLAVLQTLPGISTNANNANASSTAQPATTDIAQRIIDLRQNIQSPTDAIYQTPAWLMVEDATTFTPTLMRTLDKYVTARAQVFRVQAVGDFNGKGPTARIEAVIDSNNKRPRVLYFRDLTDLGKGFDLPASAQ